MQVLFRREDEGRVRIVEVIKLDDDEFERIVWRAEHSLVEFVPANKTFLFWKAHGNVTVRALGVLVGRDLVDRDIAVFRAVGVLGIPEQRGKRSIFPLSWNTIPVRDLRAMFMRVLWDRRLSLPSEMADFYFIPPLTLPRSRTYTSAATTRAMRTQLWVYTKDGMPEVCQETNANGENHVSSPTHPGG